MSESMEGMSVAEIQQLLKKKQSKVHSLQRRREQLALKLSEIDGEIAELTGGETTGGGIRFRNEKSLEEVIVDVLKKNKKGLGLSDLTNAILETGYQTSSANFKNVVYQNLYRSTSIARDEGSGKYILA